MGNTYATEAMEKLTESRSTKGTITVRRTYRGGELRVLPLRGVCAWLVAGLLVVGLVFHTISRFGECRAQRFQRGGSPFQEWWRCHRPRREHKNVGTLPEEVKRQARLRTTSNHREQERR